MVREILILQNVHLGAVIYCVNSEQKTSRKMKKKR